MAASLTVCRTGAATMNSGLTRYSTIGGHLTLGTTEAAVQTLANDSGSFSNMGIYVSAFSLTGGGSPTNTFSLNKNGTTTAVSVSINGTGLFESASSVAVTNTDLINYESVNGGTSGSITFRTAFIQFTPTALQNTITHMIARGAVNYNFDNATYYAPPNGYCDALGSTEGPRQIPIRFPATARDLHAYINSNARDPGGNTYIRWRVNGANTSPVLTIAGGTTGQVTSGNAVVMAADDTCNFAVENEDAGGGTGLPGDVDGGTIAIALMAITLTASRGEFAMISSQSSGGVSMAALTLHYLAVGGRTFSETTEDRAEALPHFPMYVRALEAYIVNNTLDLNRALVTLRKGGVSSALAASIALLHDQIISSGPQKIHITSGVDTISIEVDTTDESSGAAEIQWTSLVGCFPKAPPPPRQRRRVFQRSR